MFRSERGAVAVPSRKFGAVAKFGGRRRFGWVSRSARALLKKDPDVEWRKEIGKYSRKNYPETPPYAGWRADRAKYGPGFLQVPSKRGRRHDAAKAISKTRPRRCPIFREDFGFVYDKLKAISARKKEVADAAEALRMTMNEDLCRRFLDIVESLATDPRTARGAFYRWKGRALRHGAWGARPLHADLADRAMRQSTPAELTASVLEEHVVKAENAPNPLGAPSVVVMDDAPRPGTAPPALGRTRPPIEGRPMPMEARLHAAALPETEPFPGAGGRRAPARGPLSSRPRTAGDRPDGVRGMTTYRQARRLPPLTPELRSKAAPRQLGADPAREFVSFRGTPSNATEISTASLNRRPLHAAPQERASRRQLVGSRAGDAHRAAAVKVVRGRHGVGRSAGGHGGVAVLGGVRKANARKVVAGAPDVVY